MKKVLLVFLLFLYQVNNAQQQLSLLKPVPDIKREGIMFLKEPPPKISCDFTKYFLKSSSHIFTFAPLERIKFTVKAGLNGKNVAKEIRDSFGDIEAYSNVIGLVNYDARMKLYINNKWRIVMRASQMAIPGSKNMPFEMIGVSRKI